MNRGRFALSWGRKLFFGFSWPLTILLVLIYLRSFILPLNSLELIFYITNIIGVTGLLNLGFYFIFFCPVALMMPTYYICRLWSLILILILNLTILLDAALFSHYRLHLNSFLTRLIVREGTSILPNSNILLVILYIFIAVTALTVWIKGDRIWRHMRSRFSNPVSNWYILFILISLGTSQFLYFKMNINPGLANLFPVEAFLKKEMISSSTNLGTLHYPSQNFVCSKKENPNLIVITFKKWTADSSHSELLPSLHHMKSHGTSFINHHAASFDSDESLFTLFHSIPPSYRRSSQQHLPLIETEMLNRRYEVLKIGAGTDEGSFTQLTDWATKRELGMSEPFSMFISLKEVNSINDRKISTLIEELQQRDLLGNTYIVITAGSSYNNIVPFLLFGPHEEKEEVTYATSHYDVMPTLMNKMWNCKKTFLVDFSKHLDLNDRDWLMLSNENNFEIKDFKNRTSTIVEDYDIKDVVLDGEVGSMRRNLILQALQLNKKYYQRD